MSQPTAERTRSLFNASIATLRVHSCARTEHFDDLDELVDAAVAGEYRRAEEQLAEHCAHTPHVDLHAVDRRLEHELGRAVVAASHTQTERKNKGYE